MLPGGVLKNPLTGLGHWPACLALAALLAQVENPYRTAACLAVFAAQFPIQRAVLAWDASSRRVAAPQPVQALGSRRARTGPPRSWAW